MLKPLTLSVSLALALGACGVSMAGHHGSGYDGCSTCGLASPQGPIGSPQSVVASPQGYYGGCGDVCDTGCGKKKHCLSGLFHHKPKCYTYEWVLKKKKVHGHGGGCGGGGGGGGCDTCGGGYGGGVYPSGQYASPQGGVYSTGQTYGTGQAYGTGQVYGAGQATPASAPGGVTSAPAPPPSGDEAPPAPPVSDSGATETPAPPAPSTPPAANAPQSSLLFLNPAGN